MNSFHRPYWTLAQVLAWALTEDHDLVSEFGDNEASAASLWDRLLVYPNIASLGAVRRSLYHFLEDGKVQVTGRLRGAGSNRPIPPHRLAGMYLFFDVNRHGDVIAPSRPGNPPRLDFMPGRDWWGTLRFRRSDVIKLAPEQNQSAQRQPKQLGPKRAHAKMTWWPIYGRARELHADLRPGEPVQYVYERLLDEIKDIETELGKTLEGGYKIPRSIEAIGVGLRTHFGTHWYKNAE